MLKTLVLLSANRFRQEQISFLRSIPGLELLEVVDTQQAFWQSLCNRQPDLVILDESIFSDPVLSLLVRLKCEFSQVACLVFAEKHQQIERAVIAGADRVLLRGFSTKEFILALDEIRGG